jgi:large subunit ribosomal protein L21
MYAVIRAGGKQYRVAPGDVVRLEKLTPGDNGQVQFDVLAVSSSDGEIGPGGNAQVTGQVLDEGRGGKILVFHYKRKKQYKKLQGHRQAFSAVRITQIDVDGQMFKAPELQAKPRRAPKSEAAGAAPEEAVAPKKKASKGGSKTAKRGSAGGAVSKTTSRSAGTSKATGSKTKGGKTPKK